MSSLYFDYAAATPMSETVFDAMHPYFVDNFYNPSALYMAAEEVKRVLVDGRESVAKVLECKPSEIIFTAGGTESDNMAIRGVVDAFPGAHCIVSAIEHDAVLEPAKNYPHTVAPVQADGRMDVTQLEQLITDQTVLISIMYSNNEIGTVQPLHDIARLVEAIRSGRKQAGNSMPLYLHTDACQAANYLPLLVNTLGVDLMTLNGGKIYGPKQSGILFLKTGTKLSPQILGGGQERGYRSGTENVPAIIGFARALTEAQARRGAESERTAAMQHDFITYLATKRPDIQVNGSLKFRIPNNIHITIPGADNERLLMELDERGMQVATGSACSASSDEPSHVLKAIGLSDEQAQSSLRITFGRQTSAADSIALADELLTLLA